MGFFISIVRGEEIFYGERNRKFILIIVVF